MKINNDEKQFGGYADTIMTEPAEYDTIEVHGVVEETDGKGGTICEVNDDSPEFFSVYAHLVEGGVDCIGDFETLNQADDYASTIGARFNLSVVSYANLMQAAA